MAGLGWQELVIVLVIIMIIFGAGKLPEVAKSLGKGVKEFKTEANASLEEGAVAAAETATAAGAAATGAAAAATGAAAAAGAAAANTAAATGDAVSQTVGEIRADQV